jgi:hypothetical protein
LVKAFLRAGIFTEERELKDTNTGTPQGSILSPLLSNVALSVLDEHIVQAPGRPAELPAGPVRRRLCATNATGGCDVEDRADSRGVALVMEVWPSGIALQGEVSNYCELLR